MLYFYLFYPEWTDIVKDKFGLLTESETIKSLQSIYKDLNLEHYSLTFECYLKIPKLTDKIVSDLRKEFLNDYFKISNPQEKEIRQILEFLIHRPLESLDLGSKNDYIAVFQKLNKIHKNKIPTYITIDILLPPSPTTSHREKIVSIVEKMKKSYEKALDLEYFEKVKKDCECFVPLR